MERILYTRVTDGCHPVHLVGTSDNPTYQLHLPNETQNFCSARQLLIAITGHPEARHWTMDRYFRMGQYAPFERKQGTPILDAFGPRGWALGDQLATPSGIIAIKKKSQLGIDLDKRGHEVAKLLYAGFNGLMRSAGYNPDDVLQEVFKGILIRNRGKCPFDPRKASFGHYVHMVCRCVLSNYHRRAQRYSEPLQRDLPGGSPTKPLSIGQGEDKSFAMTDDRYNHEIRTLRDAILNGPHHPQRSIAVEMIPYIIRYQGKDRVWNITEIAENLGVSKAATAKALTLIRHSLRRAAKR